MNNDHKQSFTDTNYKHKHNRTLCIGMCARSKDKLERYWICIQKSTKPNVSCYSHDSILAGSYNILCVANTTRLGRKYYNNDNGELDCESGC